MALPRKGTRLIEVDGAEYRWLIRRKPTYSQGNAWVPMTVAIELCEEPQQSLIVELSDVRPDNWAASSSAQVTPAQVVELIRSGLADGWQPSKPGSPHVLRVQK
jgi:hypothetical protein